MAFQGAWGDSTENIVVSHKLPRERDLGAPRDDAEPRAMCFRASEVSVLREAVENRAGHE